MRTVLRAAVAALAAVGLIVMLVMFTPLVSWWGGKLAEPWLDSTGDVLIVLAGSNLEAGRSG